MFLRSLECVSKTDGICQKIHGLYDPGGSGHCPLCGISITLTDVHHSTPLRDTAGISDAHPLPRPAKILPHQCPVFGSSSSSSTLPSLPAPRNPRHRIPQHPRRWFMVCAAVAPGGMLIGVDDDTDAGPRVWCQAGRWWVSGAGSEDRSYPARIISAGTMEPWRMSPHDGVAVWG